MGVPPTGKAIVLTGTYIRRVVDGRVVEEWDTTDIFGLARDWHGYERRAAEGGLACRLQ
jgi:predicted ester cyclase